MAAMTPRNDGNRSSVTLIIPTVHHRAALYARALRHLSVSGYRGRIIVSDHSPPQHADAVARAGARHGELDITLLRHAPEVHFLARLIHCAAAAATPYVHLHADDDFLVIAILDRLVGEMDRNPDCAAAMGINLHAWLDSGQISVLLKTPVPHSDPFDRLIAQLESYSSVLYALRRREEWISSLSSVLERCPDVQFWQYLESCLASIKGPIAVLDELHYVRGVHDDKWSATLVRERSPDHFPYLILSPQFAPRLARFRAALIAACEANGAGIDTGRLDAGLVHLLHRGLGAMGLPERQLAGTPSPPSASLDALQGKFRDRGSPAAFELERIFASARGTH